MKLTVIQKAVLLAGSIACGLILIFPPTWHQLQHDPSGFNTSYLNTVDWSAAMTRLGACALVTLAVFFVTGRQTD